MTRSTTTRTAITTSMPAADLHALPGRCAGAELRLLRERAGLTQRGLAELVGCSDSLLGFVENAHRPLTERLARDCDTALATGGLLARLAAMARRFGAVEPPVAELIGRASELRLSDPLHVPALAQTEDYARALYEAHALPRDAVNGLLGARPRLATLLGEAPGLRAWIVLDQTALYRPVGSGMTLRRQLRHLLDLVDTGRVVAQVLSTASSATALLRLPQVLLTLDDGSRLAHVPNLAPFDGAERYTDPAAHDRAFDLLRAAAHAPGPSRGLIATASR